MKVKLFVSMSTDQLEAEINRFLDTKNPDIVDIKFSVAEKYVSALVIYKK